MYVICGRPDLGEKYLAEMQNPSHDRLRAGIDPVVRVLAVLTYPRQHALYWPDVPIEIPPIGAGVYCRLHVYRDATDAEAERYTDYAASLEEAQRDYLSRCDSPEERGIVERHMRGEYRRKRMARYFDALELDKYI